MKTSIFRLISSLNTRMKNFLYACAGFLIVAILWYIASAVFSYKIIPFPHKVVMNLINILSTKEIYFDIFLTLFRSIIGFFLAFVSGFIIGYLMGKFHFLDKSLYPLIALIQGAPPLIWVIPLILILGTKGNAALAIVYFVSLPLVTINVYEGRKSINRNYYDMFRIYANSSYLRIKELTIPLLSPYIKSSIALGIALSLKSSIIGEWFGARNGVGKRINELFYSYDILTFFSISLLFLIIIVTTSYITKFIVEYFFPDRKKSSYKKSSVTSNDKKREFPFFNQIQNKTDSAPKERKIYFAMENVSFNYGAKTILDSVDFEAREGKTILLSGDSGEGKTTFAKIALGLLKPDSGIVKIPENSGIIFQDDVLLNHLDCYGNVKLTSKWKNIEYFEEKSLYYLELCGLKEAINLYPDQLSGGMKKRLALARAMALNPDFMILDEPFNNLDKEARAQMWSLYRSLFIKRGITSIIITHYPEEAVNLSDEIYILRNGKINLA